MILLKKRAHLTLKISLEMVRLLLVDVMNQRAQRRRTYREQPIPALPREIRNSLLLHPNGRTSLDFRHNLSGRSRRGQSHREMNVIGDPTHPKAFAIQLARSPRKVSVKSGSNLVIDQGSMLFRREDNMHQVEAQRLWHGDDFMSGLQPSPVSTNTYLGFRPRLVCRRTFGPQFAHPHFSTFVAPNFHHVVFAEPANSDIATARIRHHRRSRPNHKIIAMRRRQNLSNHRAPKARLHTSLGRRPR
jgi:hypothetical protein